MFVSRDPGLYFCTFALLYLWPAATNVVAFHPHQSKWVKRLYPLQTLSVPATFSEQRKGRDGN